MFEETRGQAPIRYLATKPTMVITTLHATGVANAGVFGAYTNLSPSQVGVAISTSSHTYGNIRRSGEFVINVPGADIVKALAVIAGNVPETESEIEKAGLTAKPGVAVETPGIHECQAAVELVLDKEIPIGHHGFIVGKVVGGWIREDVLDSDGGIDIFKARVMKDFKYPQPLYVLPGEVVSG